MPYFVQVAVVDMEVAVDMAVVEDDTTVDGQLMFYQEVSVMRAVTVMQKRRN
jgi:hypothetical protein